MDADRRLRLSGAALRPARRTWPVLLAFAASLAALLGVLSAITVRTDMLDLLPEGRTAAARLVLDEARSGAATGLILVGIDGADIGELARISRAMAAGLPASGLFEAVAGGDAALPPDALEALFARRYQLADADFGADSLRAGMQSVLRQLRSSAAPLATRFGLADPQGVFTALLRGWAGDSRLRSIEGAWFAADRDRALLLARTRAGGMDVPAQEAALDAIATAFRQAGPGSARLTVAGPAAFARDAAHAIRGDVERLSLLSTALVALLLWWRFRSLLVIMAIAAPVVLSVAVAALAVQAGFGAVHGVTLGFGATMLGICVDYPVLMIGHRKRGEAAASTRARIGRAYVMAVVTATLGLASMVFSGFPGLAQLGVFSAVGLATGAALTWFAVPRLIVAANLAPVSSGHPAWLPRIERFRRWRAWGAVPVAAALAYLAAMGGPRWEDDLANLSPVPAASRALDETLRAEIGAPDAGQIVMVQGSGPEDVLRRQEALAPVLDQLRRDGAIRGAEYAARLLPSQARQAARLAALPDPATLAARVDAARAGLPFQPGAFQPLLDAVAAAPTMPTLRPADLSGTPLGARLGPLLGARDGGWRGPVVLQGVTDPARLAAAVAGPGVTYVDTRAELGGILGYYTARAWSWLGWSGLLTLAALGAGLRSPAMVGRVLGSVLAAALVTASLLTAAGLRLSLVHVMALQLVAGVGLDYALFFARRQLDAEERARTFRTLVTCNAMTLLTFGLLASCQTPVLRDIGVTVGCGAALALGFAFLAVGEAPASA